MGALTIPMFFHGVQVVSGDVLALEPRGLLRLFASPFLAVVDLRDRSIPYLVRRSGSRVLKLPLDGAPFLERGYRLTVYRLPGIDKARASTIAACVAERHGEGIHHPDYDCGREIESDEALVREAYAAAGIAIAFERGRPGTPLVPVRGPQDPPNAILPATGSGDGTGSPGAPAGAGTEAAQRGALGWLARGIPRSLPWQRRSRR